MTIQQIRTNKKDYLDLLLLGDEQEDMIDRYLEWGEMFALFDPDVMGVCVVVQLDDGVFEIKNLAVEPSAQGKGYGRKLIEFVMEYYHGRMTELLVGTGDSPLTVPFYQKCGFTEHHRVKNFFTDNYDHPIYEAGVQLVDMIYLSRIPEQECD